MKQITFQCTLLSDVIINQRSASTGNQKTLDFIPGSNFYGIVANKFYQPFNEKDKSSLNEEMKTELFTLLHSGKLCFGDAHPALNGERALRVPAAMFYPKLGSIEECYIHHALTGLSQEEITKLAQKQLKQCRNGFYVFTENGTGIPIEVNKTFAIKSAYDHNSRRSKDEQMYGYQSMDKGLSLIFHLTYDEKAISESQLNKVTDLLNGKHRVGRSRTAQYGLVNIEKTSETSTIAPIPFQNGKEVVVYADSRLIFFDDYHLPTFTPKATDFGFRESDEIVWEKSQIRTFQYSPWNYARQAYDADRCGIEKGSVVVIKLDDKGEIPPIYPYVGVYHTEGFGHVLFNPTFLCADGNGKACYKLLKKEKEESSSQPRIALLKDKEEPLLKFLYQKGETERILTIIYKEANNFVRTNKEKFAGKDQKEFAAQWGKIRSLATQCSNKEEIEEKLYTLETSYLTHGIAAEKWKESERLKNLTDFVDGINKAIGKNNVPLAVINLASEMAKLCSRKNVDK